MKRTKLLILIGITVILLGFGGIMVRESSAAGGNYKILAWNDLGMHCYNRDFADMAVLPPYNTFWVQVVKEGNPPELVTAGIRVEYFYADNTYSVGKTNFWSYDQALFGVDLPPNVGLKGKGLSGVMDLAGDHFVAEGIPITEFSDSAPAVRQPYQLATVVVKDATTGAVLTSTQVVTPTSSEMRCDNCHSDTGIAKPSNPTGKVETNILQLHDENTGTTLMTKRPVLCASCHASNALGAPGQAGVKNLSKSMHEHHAGVIPGTLDGCYNCHPGPQTRCLRDVMSVEKGMTCVSCHGGMSTVSNNPNPWLHEPRCDACHNSGAYNQDQPLYRFSKGHGDLYCEACHDSTHAIAPSREANDAIKFTQLQGKNGPIEECSVCHTVTPGGGGVHGIKPPIISGNAGAAGVKLSYTDGSPKTATSQADGSYTFSVSYNWSGTVTPSHTCFTFNPGSQSYNSIKANQSNQNYTAVFNPASGCADIDVLIGGVNRGSFGLLPGMSTRASFSSVNSGPVGIMNNNAIPIIGAERVIYKVNGVNTSFSEMMGMPAGQVGTTYWLPWYNSVSLNTQLRIANVSNTDGTVTITIGTQNMGSFPLAAGASTRRSYVGIDKGPVKIVSNVNIVASERVLYRVNGIDASFSEMMATPNSQLDTIYWLPWYNNVSLDTQLRIANVGPTTATVHVSIGGAPVTGSPFTIPVNGSIRRSFPGIDKGPVKIESNQPVVAAERVIYKANGVNTSFSETMATPNSQLDTIYWLPWYNNKSLDTQLRIANVGPTTATVHVSIGGTPALGSPFSFPVGASKRLSFAGIDKGPVKIESNVNVVVSERVIYKVNNVVTSFSEMMGLPNSQLDTIYWLPWYNNLDLDTQLRFAAP